MKRGLRKFQAGFPRSCCLTNPYSKLKFVTYINVSCFLIFGFETEKSIYFNKKHVPFKIRIQIESKLSICTKQSAVRSCSMDLKKAVRPAGTHSRPQSPSLLGQVVLKRGALEAAITGCQKISDIRSRMCRSYEYHWSCS